MRLDHSNTLPKLDDAVHALSDAHVVRSPDHSSSFGAHVNNNIRIETVRPSSNQAKDARAELEAEVELALARGDEPPKNSLYGCMKGKLEIIGDIISPIDEIWDAER